MDQEIKIDTPKIVGKAIVGANVIRIDGEDAKEYEIYRNGKYVATLTNGADTNGAGLDYKDTDIINGQEYSYKVRAITSNKGRSVVYTDSDFSGEVSLTAKKLTKATSVLGFDQDANALETANTLPVKVAAEGKVVTVKFPAKAYLKYTVYANDLTGIDGSKSNADKFTSAQPTYEPDYFKYDDVVAGENIEGTQYVQKVFKLSNAGIYTIAVKADAYDPNGVEAWTIATADKVTVKTAKTSTVTLTAALIDADGDLKTNDLQVTKSDNSQECKVEYATFSKDGVAISAYTELAYDALNNAVIKNVAAGTYYGFKVSYTKDGDSYVGYTVVAGNGVSTYNGTSVNNPSTNTVTDYDKVTTPAVADKYNEFGSEAQIKLIASDTSNTYGYGTNIYYNFLGKYYPISATEKTTITGTADAAALTAALADIRTAHALAADAKFYYFVPGTSAGYGTKTVTVDNWSQVSASIVIDPFKLFDKPSLELVGTASTKTIAVTVKDNNAQGNSDKYKYTIDYAAVNKGTLNGAGVGINTGSSGAIASGTSLTGTFSAPVEVTAKFTYSEAGDWVGTKQFTVTEEGYYLVRVVKTLEGFASTDPVYGIVAVKTDSESSTGISIEAVQYNKKDGTEKRDGTVVTVSKSFAANEYTTTYKFVYHKATDKIPANAIYVEDDSDPAEASFDKDSVLSFSGDKYSEPADAAGLKDGITWVKNGSTEATASHVWYTREVDVGGYAKFKASADAKAVGDYTIHYAKVLNNGDNGYYLSDWSDGKKVTVAAKKAGDAGKLADASADNDTVTAVNNKVYADNPGMGNEVGEIFSSLEDGATYIFVAKGTGATNKSFVSYTTVTFNKNVDKN